LSGVPRGGILTYMRTRIPASLLAAVLLAGAPLLAACGGVAQQAAEQAAEKAVGGNVDITDDGIKVQASGGNEIQIGADVAVPDNWPKEIPVPDGAKLTSVMVAGDGSSVNAMWSTEGTAADVASAYDAALTGAGFTQDNTATVAGTVANDYSGNGYTVNVVVTDAGGTTSLLLNATKG
jgi:hypothetical protein